MLKNLRRIIKEPRLIFTHLLSQYCHWMNDECYLKILYFIYLGKFLHLKSPRTFNEKLQWLKLYNRCSEYMNFVDKVAVKNYVTSMIGSEYIIPTLGIWDKFDDINFETLPEQFVLKCTHDSGGVVICKSKESLDKKEAKRKIESSLKKNYFYAGREYPYKNIIPQIIAEKYMVDESGTELKDYKVHVFNGIPYVIQVDFDRFTNHRRNLYSTDWLALNKGIKFPMGYDKEIQKPVVLEKMLELSVKLASDIPYIRCDFYCVENKLYFGELTFYHGSGFETFTPKSFDRELGRLIKLPQLKQ